MGQRSSRVAAFAGAVFSFVMVPSAAFAGTSGRTLPESTAVVGAIVVLVLGLASLTALIVLKRLEAARDERRADVDASSEVTLAEDELAA